MRWIKHLTMAHADREMSLALEEFGAAAYGVYWLLIEEIAAPMEAGKNEPVAVHTLKRWAQICHCSTRVLQKFLRSFEKKSLIFCETSELAENSGEKLFQICVPNILKYKDEYSKKSGVTPEFVRRVSERRAEREQRESREDTLPPTPLPQAEGGGECPKPVSILPAPNPEGWGSLLANATRVGMVYSAPQLKAMQKLFTRLPNEEQQAAVEGIDLRVDSGEYRDPHFVPTLVRYLAEKLYTAPTRPPPKPVAAQNKAQAMEVFEQRWSREHGPRRVR